jgi:hypothetical protein
MTLGKEISSPEIGCLRKTFLDGNSKYYGRSRLDGRMGSEYEDWEEIPVLDHPPWSNCDDIKGRT